MTKQVISTLPADNRYVGWVTKAGVKLFEKSVLVKGSGIVLSGMASLIAPPLPPVRTELSDEDAKWLEEHDHFIAHRERGFVEIVDKPMDCGQGV